MCKSIELLSELEDVLYRINVRNHLLAQELSKADRMRDVILHKIEDQDQITASFSYNCTKALKIIAEKRREVKNELHSLVPIKAQFAPMLKKAVENREKVEKTFDKMVNKSAEDYRLKDLPLDFDGNILAQVKEIYGIE